MLSLTGINLQTKSVIECRNKIFCFNYLIFILAHFFVGICGVDVIATERILSYLSECNNVEYIKSPRMIMWSISSKILIQPKIYIQILPRNSTTQSIPI